MLEPPFLPEIAFRADGVSALLGARMVPGCEHRTDKALATERLFARICVSLRITCLRDAQQAHAATKLRPSTRGAHPARAIQGGRDIWLATSSPERQTLVARAHF
jgi:hypothetical protein